MGDHVTINVRATEPVSADSAAAMRFVSIATPPKDLCKALQKSSISPNAATDRRGCRRLRNRLSQKAHRVKQAEYIKQLEKRLEHSTETESVRNSYLKAENELLRQRFLDCYKKLGSLQASFQALTDSVGEVLQSSVSFLHLECPYHDPGLLDGLY